MKFTATAILALLGFTATASTKQTGRPPAGLYFTPLTQSNTATDAASQATHPFIVPEHWHQTLIVDKNMLISYFDGSFPSTFGSFDMMTFAGDNNKYIFVPTEVSNGAGIFRVTRDADDNFVAANVLLKGVAGGPFSTTPATWNPLTDNYGTMDPTQITPASTILVAEEGGGKGRMFELLNPFTATNVNNAQWRWLSNIPAVAHEGVQFDKSGNMYFIDENSSGSVYKFVPKVTSDYSLGQVFVLRVTGKAGIDRAVGPAEWVPITDTNNVKVTTANPFDFTARGGRVVADELGANGYCRPEDMTVTTLKNGNQAVYFTATCTNNVYSIELLPGDGTKAIIREYFSAFVTPDTIGNNPVGAGSSESYGLQTPDNLDYDQAGNVLVVEDNDIGDIWWTTDTNGDGVADACALMFSLGDYGCEPTGLQKDPNDPFSFFVHVQHPSDGNDAMWKLSHDVTNYCDCQGASSVGKYVSCVSQACNDMGITGDMKTAMLQIAQLSTCGSRA